jgi:hypothetical protein
VLEGTTAIGSLRASRRLTRGRWWRTFGFTAFVDILAIVSGPILGILILLLASESLTFIDITGLGHLCPDRSVCSNRPDSLLLRPFHAAAASQK